MKTQTLSMSPREEAVMLHSEILQRGAAAAGALADFCHSLKKMRDSRLYTELGCDTFDAYCEERAGIRARMAYNYIAAYERLGDGYVREHALLGITKLEVLSRMEPEDREGALEDAEDMSVSQLRELQEQLSAKGRQISILTDELEGEKKKGSDLLKEAEEAKRRAQEALSAETKRAAELEAALNEAKAAGKSAAAPSEKEKNKWIKEGEKRGRDAAANEKNGELEKERAKVKAAAEKEAAVRERLEKLSAEKAAAEAEVEKLRRKIASSDASVGRVKVYFESIQEDFNKMLAVISEAEPETREKLLSAAGKLLEVCGEALRGAGEENDM